MNPKTQNPRKRQKPDWVGMVAPYRYPDTKKSIWQFASTLALILLSWVVMYWSLAAGYWWLTLLLIIPAAGFLVRMFIIQHDCGHGSFFKSRKANDRVGKFASIFSMTPYYQWRKSHAIHHAHASNLDERFIGDIPTWTVDEYLEKDRWDRLKYRLFRFPPLLFIVLPFGLFFILYRFPSPNGTKKERMGVLWTNVALAALWITLIAIVGWQAFLIVHVSAMWLAACLGTWLFFVQHQFEETYWEHQEDWDFTLAGLQGSSYYKLPKVLQWFTGNIGFHHIHHLSPKIPNYKLEQCHNENPLFQQVITMTLRTSLETMFLSLWDKNQRRLISFREMRRLQRA